MGPAPLVSSVPEQMHNARKYPQTKDLPSMKHFINAFRMVVDFNISHKRVNIAVNLQTR